MKSVKLYEKLTLYRSLLYDRVYTRCISNAIGIYLNRAIILRMIYFSELKGKSVRNENNQKIGVLEDLTFLAEDTPKITKLVINNKSPDKIIIPIEYLSPKSIGLTHETIFVKNDYHSLELQINEMFLGKNLLDKQIIDLVGHKVVRVNDIALQDKPELNVVGVDVGVLGILRWLNLDGILIKAHSFFNIHISSKLLPWANIQPLELARGKVVLKKEDKKLKRLKPEDLAIYLNKTTVANTVKILKILNIEQAVKVISSLSPNYQTALFQTIKSEQASNYLFLLPLERAANILLDLSKKKRGIILSLLDEEKRQELLHLIELTKISAIGRALTTKCLSVPASMTVKQVINQIKTETEDFPALNYIYVTNENKQLVGALSLHELLMENFDTPVYKLMNQNLIMIHLNTPKELAIKDMLRYKLDALPVVDKNRKILGMVVLDDLTDQILEKI